MTALLVWHTFPACQPFYDAGHGTPCISRTLLSSSKTHVVYTSLLISPISMKNTSTVASVLTGVSRLYCHVSPTLGTQPSPPPAEAGCSVSGVDGTGVGSTTGAGSGDGVVGIVGAGTGVLGVGAGADSPAVICIQTKDEITKSTLAGSWRQRYVGTFFLNEGHAD